MAKIDLIGAIQERDFRSKEMLSVYRPLPNQLRIFESKAPELIVRGGNRSGKTTSVSVLFASLATGRSVMATDEEEIPSPWPSNWSNGGNKLLWVVGYDEKHIGQTIHRHLFKPGLFQVIRDRHTKKYRLFRPWDNRDIARQAEVEDSGPLIPERFIRSWSWKDKAANVFESVELINGTVICAYSSRSEPKQGDKVHCIWIDEDIEYATHVPEWRMRLMDYRGRLIWTAFPHTKNTALVEMSEQAEEQRSWDNPIVEEIMVSMMDNPFISDESKNRALATLTEEQRQARIEGEFATESYLVYPGFSKNIHCIPSSNESRWDEIDKVASENQRPRDWTRYMSIDPGFQTCAVLFGAVPPPGMFDYLNANEQYLVIERELYLHRKSIPEVAAAIKPLVEGFIYETFVIDYHAARQTPMSGGKTIYDQLREEFEKLRIESRSTGSGFARGNDDIQGRIEIARSYMQLNRAFRPRLRIFKQHCPGLIHEFSRYRFRLGRNGETNERPIKQKDHAMDAMGYLVSLKPEYVFADYSMAGASPAYLAYQKMISRQRAKAGNQAIYLGPGGLT